MKYILTILSLMTMTTAQPSLHYTLAMPRPWNHLFEVTTEISGIQSKTIDLSMPAWRTGRYVIFDFSGAVQEFTAHTPGGKKLAARKVDKDTWRIERGTEPTVIVTYNVYANDFNQRTRELDGDHGFVDPSSVFMYINELKARPLRVTVKPFGNWHVTTGLDEIPGETNTFAAPSFDYLIDCPIEIGTQKDFEFSVEGKKHVISIFGEGNWNSDTLIADFTKIIKANNAFWGTLPYEKYIFMIQCQPNAGGGTEHLNSTVMGVRPFIFSNPASYKNFLGLVSHEYFHTWNVKQLRPKAFAPYDLSREGYSEELWISEGSTSYFDELLLIQAGLATGKNFTDQIPGMVSSDRSRYGNTIQPLSESSFDAWVKFWRDKENAFIAQSNYYGKGSHLSLLLDLEIRHRSKNASSLQSVMRKMFETYPPAKGFTNADFIAMCERYAGGSLADFFASYLYGTAPLPWEQNLLYAGLELTQQDSSVKPNLGLLTRTSGERIIVSTIIPGSPAEKARMEINDEIIAVNGFKVRPSDFTDRIASFHAGDSVSITLFRNDKLKEVTAAVGLFGTPGYSLKKTEHPTELQKSIYESWLHDSL